jgi:hypothetical protein
MKRDEFYSFMNENVGKKCTITNDVGTLDDHVGYNGEELTIKEVTEDGYYVLDSGHYCDDNEVDIINL